MAAGLAKTARVRKAKAVDAYANLAEHMTEPRGKSNSPRHAAEALHSDGHTTRSGTAWSAARVMRVLGRIPTSRPVQSVLERRPRRTDRES